MSTTKVSNGDAAVDLKQAASSAPFGVAGMGHDDPDDDGSNNQAMTEDERKLEEKRAYNRRNAARARKRTKDQLAELCRKVEALTDRNKSLEGANAELTKRVVALTDENVLLRRIILEKQTSQNAAMSVSSAIATGGGASSVPNYPYGSGHGGAGGSGGPQGGHPFSFNPMF